MAGGKATPKKDKALKVSGGERVLTGEILSRGLSTYKAGINVKGIATLHALCPGEIYFTRKKTSHGKARTFLNVRPQVKKPAK